MAAHRPPRITGHRAPRRSSADERLHPASARGGRVQRRLGSIGCATLQGFEAGGHRGSFSDSPGAGMVGTMAPVPQVVDAVRVPVIAPAASPTDEGLAAAFALGASGAQLQTISGLPGRNCCAAPSLATAQGRRRQHGAGTRLHRPASTRLAQSLYRPDGLSAAGQCRRSALASAQRCGPGRINAVLGGSGGAPVA